MIRFDFFSCNIYSYTLYTQEINLLLDLSDAEYTLYVIPRVFFFKKNSKDPTKDLQLEIIILYLGEILAVVDISSLLLYQMNVEFLTQLMYLLE